MRAVVRENVSAGDVNTPALRAHCPGKRRQAQNDCSTRHEALYAQPAPMTRKG
ncbi:MAG: hypothetical protein Fur0032_16230 [Terrimicrobiaceae bacterium]